MNWLKVGVALLSLWLFGFSSPVQALDPQAFTIRSFDADYRLEWDAQKASSLSVNERIVAQFPDYDQNHGILRAIPERYQDHTISLKILAVKDGRGSALKYTTYRENDNLVLKIGDADRYIRGKQTYVIDYSMRNVINWQPGHDEFYWDINGDQWPQVFQTVSATIHIPDGLSSALQDRQLCYAGNSGSNNAKCTINRQVLAEETLITATTEALSPRQTLSVVLAFNKASFAPGPEIAREQRDEATKNWLSFGGWLGPPLIASWLMYRRWRQFGDDPKGRGIIIPEYEPPQNLKLLEHDFISQGNLRNLALSSLIVQLATQGHLTIYEIPKKGLFGSKDFELELTSLPEPLDPQSKTALKLIFGNSLGTGQRVKLGDFKKSASKRRTLYEGLRKVEQALADKLTTAGYYIKDPLKIRTAYMLWAMAPLMIGIGVIILGAALASWPVGWLGFGLILAALVMFMFAFIMPARTQKGVEAYDHLLGLKDYIKMAEAERLRYLQSPEGAEKIRDAKAFNPKSNTAKLKLFEKLLPYAMLFGLEKDWAKQFADIYTQPPDWYHGHWTSFNAGYLGGSLSDLASSSSTAFAAPSSSSGSGFSGGGSGGGGGGGGGGGW